MAPMAGSAQVRLTVEPGLAPVEADSDRLMQVATNLLSNADKFSPPGSDVEVGIVSAPGGVQLIITDQGRGIPAGKLETIFDRFQQIDASDAKQRGGTGLGLAICRTIVQQHGGRIWAEHNPAGGSIFNVYLPSKHIAAQNRPQDLPATGSGFYPYGHAAQIRQLEIDAPEVANS
jgi:signal transduction histidine kinase